MNYRLAEYPASPCFKTQRGYSLLRNIVLDSSYAASVFNQDTVDWLLTCTDKIRQAPLVRNLGKRAMKQITTIPHFELTDLFSNGPILHQLSIDEGLSIAAYLYLIHAMDSHPNLEKDKCADVASPELMTERGYSSFKCLVTMNVTDEVMDSLDDAGYPIASQWLFELADALLDSDNLEQFLSSYFDELYEQLDIEELSLCIKHCACITQLPLVAAVLTQLFPLMKQRHEENIC
ncbi:hypothetical protein L1D14_10485 [Vibrio tubiashii]|uniref:hypothetical protein n=1 Tax=Vibrio tubiashii TaxID=29498 RepID=UPI001EFE041B|nr:hypothetical protein [Vibrio tubiashii]MCG9576664.1 hypothetical protein [Vibrio tubiashii]